MKAAPSIWSDKVIRDFDWPACRVLIFGTGGSGKTTKLLQLIAKQKAKWVFIFDHKHEFGVKLGQKYCYTEKDIFSAIERGGYVCFDPVEMFPGDKPTAFKWFCDFVYHVSGHLRGRKLFICDELHRLISTMERPREFLLLVDDGRCFKVDLFCCCQAGNSVHNEVRNQITQAYSFRQSEENAVKFLASNGYNENEIRALQPGEYIWRDFNSGQTEKGGKAFQVKPSGA